jgi:hypothetical protein
MKNEQTIDEQLDEITTEVTGTTGRLKDFIKEISDHAPTIALIFVDLLAVVAEIRVYDAGMQITKSPWKAIGFVALSALPFYLGQLFWAYKLASIPQRIISALFVLGGLIIGALFGRFDLLLGIDAGLVNSVAMANMVPWMTGVYMLMTLGFILADERLQMEARLAIIKYRADYSKRKNSHLRDALKVMGEAQEERNNIRRAYGDAKVDKVSQQMGGGRREQPRQPNLNPTFAADVQNETERPLSGEKRERH